MKKIFFLSVLMAIVASCDQNEKKVLNQLSQSVEIIENNSQQDSEGQKVAKMLSEVEPLSQSELKNAFPKKIKELLVDDKITVLNQQIIGRFGDKKITLSISDAAGVNNQLAAFFIDSYNMNNEEINNENFKIITKERNGIKTITDYYTANGKSEIRFLYNNRYFVTLANNENNIKANPDELWDAFDINELKNFK